MVAGGPQYPAFLTSFPKEFLTSSLKQFSSLVKPSSKSKGPPVYILGSGTKFPSDTRDRIRTYNEIPDEGLVYADSIYRPTPFTPYKEDFRHFRYVKKLEKIENHAKVESKAEFKKPVVPKRVTSSVFSSPKLKSIFRKKVDSKSKLS